MSAIETQMPSPVDRWIVAPPQAAFPAFNPNADITTHQDYIDINTGRLTNIPPGAQIYHPVPVVPAAPVDINSSHFLDYLSKLFLPTSSINAPVSGGSGGGGGGPDGGAPTLLETIRPFLPFVMIGGAIYLAYAIFFKK